MRGVSALLAAACTLLLSCNASDSFACANDDACSIENVAGQCEASGYCSFPDEECSSGRRYGENAPAELAGVCVPAEGSTGETTTTGITTVLPATSTTEPDPSTSSSSSSSTTTSADGSSSTGAPSPPANIVFVASLTVQLGPDVVEQAEVRCAEAAALGGFEGTYVPWISDPEVSARGRLEATGARGWVRPDGKPFADRVVDIASGKIWYPAVLDETGAPLYDVRTLTGSDQNGVTSSSCDGWTNFSSSTARVGRPNRTAPGWTLGGDVMCDETDGLHVYCFGADLQTPVDFEPQDGRVAFVSSASISAGAPADAVNGVERMDALCQAELEATGRRTTALALLALPDASPVSRFDLEGEPWVNALGVPILEFAGELAVAEHYETSLGFTITGTPTGDRAWMGATAAGSPGRGTCDGWTDNDVGNTTQVATPDRSSGLITNRLTGHCAQTRRLLCFEQ